MLLPKGGEEEFVSRRIIDARGYRDIRLWSTPHLDSKQPSSLPLEIKCRAQRLFRWVEIYWHQKKMT